MAKTNTIITIGRQYGSAGREIGYKVADELGIKLYDKEMLDRAAKESGLCQELFETHDEKPTSSFLYSLVMDTYSATGYTAAPFLDMPLNHKIFLAQFDTIKKLAEEESCIIVGRCADYALNDFPRTINTFIHADLEFRIKNTMDEFHVNESKAKDMISKKDKQRSSYYNYYSNKKWGNSKSYDLTLNAAKLGVDGCVEMILRYKEILGY